MSTSPSFLLCLKHNLMNYVGSNSSNLIYQRFAAPVCKEVGIEKLGLVIIVNLFLSFCLPVNSFHNIRVILWFMRLIVLCVLEQDLVHICGRILKQWRTFISTKTLFTSIFIWLRKLNVFWNFAFIHLT